MEVQTNIIYSVLMAILTSGIISAIVTGLLNYHAQIRAVKESGLYKRRTDVIDKFMRLICALDRAVGDMISPLKIGSDATKEEQEYELRRAAWQALLDLNEYYCNARHYLSQEADRKIKNFLDKSKKAFNEYVWNANPIQIHAKPNIEKWGDLWNKQYKEDLRSSAEEIIKDFRKIMGI